MSNLSWASGAGTNGRCRILRRPSSVSFWGCLNDEATRLEYESILTKSFRCQNYLKNPGDLAVLDMQGTFDKEGFYHVVSRYAIIPESVTKK